MAVVAVVAVEVGVLAEERVRALCRGETADATQGRQVEPAVVLLVGIEVAEAGHADALQVVRLEDRVQRLAILHAVLARHHRLRIDDQAPGVDQPPQVIEEVVLLDRELLVLLDCADVGVEVRMSMSSVISGLRSKFHMIFIAACGSLGSMVGNGRPAVQPSMRRPSDESLTWPAYFSVASRYALGSSTFLYSLTVIGIPCLTSHSTPGEISPFALATFVGVDLVAGLDVGERRRPGEQRQQTRAER
jgi:hypothetical protein